MDQKFFDWMTTKGYTKWQQLKMDQCHKWCATGIGTWPPFIYTLC